MRYVAAAIAASLFVACVAAAIAFVEGRREGPGDAGALLGLEQTRPVDFRFSGVAVDQRGLPVAGVQVDAWVGRLGSARETEIKVQTVTDARGRFTVASSGSWIQINLLPKDGLVQVRTVNTSAAEQTMTRFYLTARAGQEYYLPSESSPAIFVMVPGDARWSAAMMSRGGSDMVPWRPEGTLRRNEPFWPKETDPEGVRFVPAAPPQPE